MQIFSGMQRSRNDQSPLIWLFTAFAFFGYEALCMRYLFLPPMFGVLFFLYIRALDQRQGVAFAAVVVMLLVAESAKGFLLLSTLFVFTLGYFVVLPWFKSTVSCKLCLNAFIVTYAYVGYYVIILLFSQMFALAVPHIDYRILFYIAIEFFLIGLL